MDPEAQFYPYIDIEHGGQYNRDDYFNYSFYSGSQYPPPFHSAWEIRFNL